MPPPARGPHGAPRAADRSASTRSIDSLHILSDNEIDILGGDLDDLTIADDDVLDNNEILDDVEDVVLDVFLDELGITLSRSAILVCSTVAGSEICK